MGRVVDLHDGPSPSRDPRFPGVRIALCIPTLNPGNGARRQAEALAGQTLRLDEMIVLDSSSEDDSIHFYEECGASVMTIPRSEFDHGGTRRLAFSLVEADVYVFMTQDAVPCNKMALENLVRSLLSHERAGAAYGRQISAPGASPFAAHARHFNYPDQSYFRVLGDASRSGIKTAYCSNAFSAYRRSALEEVDYFPRRIICGEDTYAVAQMLKRGWGIAYAAEALITHAHEYELGQEFARYFDVGVFHGVEPWYLDLLGGPHGTGIQFVRSEIQYLRDHHAPFAIVRALTRNAVRLLGYRLGLHQALFPVWARRKMSMNKAYWTTAD